MPRSDYDLCRRVFQKVLDNEVPEEPIAAIHHDFREVWLHPFEASCVQLIYPFQQRGIIAQDIFLLFLEERPQYPKDGSQEPMELERDGFGLDKVSVLTFH